MTDETAVIAAPAPRKFEVRNFIDEATLKTDVAYSLNALSDAMQAQAGMIIHYSTLAAKAARQVDDIKLVLEATESTVYRKLRDKAVEDGAKVTETQLEKSVAASAQVLSIKRALNEAKQIEAIAKGAVEGFKHRKDMLVQEGAMSREEYKGELRVRSASAAADDSDAQKRRVLERLGAIA